MTMPREIACAKCGKPLTCAVGDAEPCWCDRLDPVELNAGYDDCLCPDCLSAAPLTR